MLRRMMTLGAVVLLAPTLPALSWATPRVLPHPAPEPSCVRECRSAYQACVSAIREELRLCRAECGELQAAAQAACAAAPRSEACVEARAAAAECLAPCRDVVNQAIAACRENLRACSADCPDRVGDATPDRTCLSTCRDGLQTCRERANAAARECNAACVDLRRAAAEACQADRNSLACGLAQRELHACVKPCQERHANALRQCQSTSNDCASSCRPPAASRR